MEISIDILQTDVKLISMKSFTDVLMAKANIIDIFKWIEKMSTFCKCKISLESSTDVLLEKA